MDRKCCITTSHEFLKHDAGRGHPENPQRLEPLHAMLETEFANIPRLVPKTASDAQLLKTHSQEMVRKILDHKGKSGWIDPDTFYCEESTDVALLAAGSCIDAALRIWNGEFHRGFCFVRPPGHHATPSKAMGFCLFNNIALAVQAVLAEKPQARLAVVDFDLHHGNGTQDAFFSNENVLFISSHRYPYYPGTGNYEEIGSGKARGTKVNFPLGQRYGDELFLDLYGSMVVPMLKEFNPEMIFVSAGFDGHQNDPMQGFQISTEGYEQLARQLLQAAEPQGKILFCLEGGYDPIALRDSVRAVLWEMNGMNLETNVMTSNTATVVTTANTATVDLFRNYFRTFFRSL